MSKKIQHRLYVDCRLPGNGLVILSPEQSHYLGNVMRAGVGDAVALFNGSEGEWASDIVEIKKKAIALRIRSQTKAQQFEPDLMLAFAPIKKARIDFIAQKTTELGVCHLQPIITRRTNVERVKTERLHTNAVEAAEQCERLTIPSVSEPIKLDKLLESWPTERMIMFCDEEMTGRSAHFALTGLSEKQKTRPWAIFIGPEGGFDDTERASIKAHANTIVVSLGPRVLRADTAAMAAISLWQSALGDW